MARVAYGDSDKYYSNNSDFVKLKDDGDRIHVQFLFDSIEELDAYICHEVKVDGNQRYVNCLREDITDSVDDCPFCANGHKLQPIFFIPVFDVDTQETKVWQRSKKFIDTITYLLRRYSDLSNHVFEIERVGKKGDKKTTYEIRNVDGEIEPFDVSEVEPVDPLDRIILNKSYEDCCEYIENGDFPDTSESTSVSRSGSVSRGRRVPANQPVSRRTRRRG